VAVPAYQQNLVAVDDQYTYAQRYRPQEVPAQQADAVQDRQ
jgi:hypothetical protein